MSEDVQGPSAAAPLPPAGWYPVPDRPGNMRWWDGQGWSDQYAPADPKAAKRALKEQAKSQRAAEKEATRQRRQHELDEAAYRTALAVWQQQHDHALEVLEMVSSFKGDTSGEGIMLRPGEGIYARITGVSLIEDRAGRGHFEGRSQGVSIPVGSIGGHAVRYHVGKSSGHYVAAPPVATAIDIGTLYLTSQRVVFQGARATRECLFAKLLAYQTSPNGAASFSVSNRQKPTVVQHGSQIAPAFDQRLELALANFRGTTADLIQRAQAALTAVDARRPAEPTAAIAP